MARGGRTCQDGKRPEHSNVAILSSYVSTLRLTTKIVNDAHSEEDEVRYVERLRLQ